MGRWMDRVRAQQPFVVSTEVQSERVAAEFAAKSVDLPPRTAFYRWLVEQERLGEGATRRGKGRRDGI